MAYLPGKYAKSEGRLYFALYKDEIAGCIALRTINKEQCEMLLGTSASIQGANTLITKGNEMTGKVEKWGSIGSSDLILQVH